MNKPLALEMKPSSPWDPVGEHRGGSFSGDFEEKTTYKERVEESSGDGFLRRGSLGNLGGIPFTGNFKR
jgi:hypothetical protein